MKPSELIMTEVMKWDAFATGELSEAQKKFIEEQEEEESGNDNHKE